MIMPFGRHRGKPIEDIPLDYLQWVIEHCTRITPTLRAAIEEVLRGDEPVALDLHDLASRWYRRLAVEYHPDRGGSHEAMVAVNRGRDLLIELVGGGR